MRFLYFGDMHESDNVPESRIDDFKKSREEKVKEILSLAKKYNVVALLQAGDFLDSPKYSEDFLGQIIRKWSPLNLNEVILDLSLKKTNPNDVAKKLEECIPLIGVVGNHELYGGNMASYEKTSLKFLVDLGFIKLTSKDNPIIFREGDFSVAITGSDYSHNMDKIKTPYILEEKKGDFNIHLVHGELNSKSMGKQIKHTTIDEIEALTVADLTIAGHDHIGFPLVEKNGKKFINPGAPVRLTCDVKEMRRIPKVLLIDVTKENGVKVTPITLKSAKKGTEVLSRDRIESEKEKSVRLEEIKSTVNKATIEKGADIVTIINSVSDSKGISEELRENIIKDVTSKMAEMTDSTTVNGKEYYIERLVLENFMSHKNSEFEFTNGLNILGGPSRTGKSTVIRAIDLLLQNKAKNPRRLIHRGEDYFKITAYLSNGYIISRVVELKKTGKNGYEIYNPHTGENSYENTKALPLVQEIMGFRNVVIDSVNSININLLKQGSSWFFIGEDTTATKRAKLIGVVYGTHFIDAVIKDYEAENKSISKEIKSVSKDCEVLKEDLSKYNYLPKMKKDIDEIESIYKELNDLISKKDSINELISERDNILKKGKEVSNLVKTLSEKEEEAKNLLYEIMQNLDDRNKVKQLISEINKNNVLEKELSNLSISLKDINEAYILINELKDLENKRYKQKNLCDEVTSLYKEGIAIKKNLDLAEVISKSMSDISDTKALIDEIKALNEKKAKLNELLKDRKTITDEGLSYKDNIKNIDNDNKILIEKYKVLLEKAGKCPVCHGTIDKAVINRILDDFNN